MATQEQLDVGPYFGTEFRCTAQHYVYTPTYKLGKRKNTRKRSDLRTVEKDERRI